MQLGTQSIQLHGWYSVVVFVNSQCNEAHNIIIDLCYYNVMYVWFVVSMYTKTTAGGGSCLVGIRVHVWGSTIYI